MPILEVTDTDILQRCIVCGRDNRIAIDTLEAGRARGSWVNERAIRLPPCECGACETLLRSSDTDPEHNAPGSFGHLHRLLVDALHDELVARGRSIAPVSRAPASLRAAASPADRQKWFPNGLIIGERAREELFGRS